MNEFYMGEQFPSDELDSIAFDWAYTAFSHHQHSKANIIPIFRSAVAGEFQDLSPSSVSIGENTNGSVPLELTTTILPEDFNFQQLTDPEPYFLDALTALVCTNILNLEYINNASAKSIGMILPTLDEESMAKQFSVIRANFANDDKPVDQTIFQIPSGQNSISLVGTKDNKFNLALRSSFAMWVADESLLELLESA